MNAPAFTLSWQGGGVERHFRRRSAAVEAMPWGTLRPEAYPVALVDRARLAWTDGCFAEYTTAIQLAGIVQGLLAVRAPVDLVGAAGAFVADEMVHVELHARVAAELGGAAPYRALPEALAAPTLDPEHPVRSLAEAVVRTCCVGEGLAAPILAATRDVAATPLVRAVLARIVDDEGPHAQLGWWFLEWAELDDDDRAALGLAAAEEIGHARRMAEAPTSVAADGVTSEGFRLADVHALGWIDTEAWRPITLAALARVEERLARFGIDARRSIDRGPVSP